MYNFVTHTLNSVNSFPAMDQTRNYKLLSAIGAGATATVFLSIDHATDKYVAIKRIGKDLDAKTLEKVRREIELLKSVNCPFIVPFYETFEDERFLYIVMECCEGGSLYDSITNAGTIPEEEARVIITELAFALYYLHNERGIIHRDVKVDNVLLDRYGHVKLSDFGFSTAIENHDPAKRTVCGSPAFCAPELVRQDAYTPKTDVWSAGVVLYVMLMGHLPFTGSNIQECMAEILEKVPVYSPHLSSECRSLLDGMLAKDSDARLSAEDLLKHPFIANGRLFNSIQRVSKLRWSGPLEANGRERMRKMAENHTVAEKTLELLGCKANGFRPNVQATSLGDVWGQRHEVRSYVKLRVNIPIGSKRNMTNEIMPSSSLRRSRACRGMLLQNPVNCARRWSVKAQTTFQVENV